MGVGLGSTSSPPFSSLETCNSKFRKLVSTDARAETMERELDRVSRLDQFYFMSAVLQFDPYFSSERKNDRSQKQRQSCSPPIKLSKAQK